MKYLSRQRVSLSAPSATGERTTEISRDDDKFQQDRLQPLTGEHGAGRQEKLDGVSTLVGLAGVTFFLLHLVSSLGEGEGIRALWACHLASLLAGGGILLRRAALVAVGVLWLLAGIPLWCVYLAIGEPFHATSLLTHLGGFAVGCHGLKLLGVPRGLWWQALAGLWVLLGIARLTSPPQLNVNLAFHVYQRGEPFTGCYPVALLLLSLVSLGLFYVGERQFRRIFDAR